VRGAPIKQENKQQREMDQDAELSRRQRNRLRQNLAHTGRNANWRLGRTKPRQEIDPVAPKEPKTGGQKIDTGKTRTAAGKTRIHLARAEQERGWGFNPKEINVGHG
jgi:hypothetical protein